ncbi:MAG: hypothetical protein E6R03_12600 [Hyphomicrobiaceae bacterium]|nr:MAG: hypothetical protein E6R03_12600 [Hyphomicrobiaceae bacterium]
MTPTPGSINYLLLERFDQNDSRTFGRLKGFETPGCPLDQGVDLGFTLEEPWRDNKHDISCIPLGKYPIRRHWSSKLGLCIAVDDVPGRDLIRMHKGNTLANTTGCILVGKTISDYRGAGYLSYSRIALNAILAAFSGDGWLEVV